MKLIIYYLSLLVFLAMVTGYLISQASTAATPMSMGTMVGISAALVIYVVGMSLIGEGPKEDERETMHRQLANRVALIVGSSLLSIGVLYQLFISHQLNYLALIVLMVINLSKIISLIYFNYKK